MCVAVFSPLDFVFEFRYACLVSPGCSQLEAAWPFFSVLFLPVIPFLQPSVKHLLHRPHFPRARPGFRFLLDSSAAARVCRSPFSWSMPLIFAVGSLAHGAVPGPIPLSVLVSGCFLSFTHARRSPRSPPAEAAPRIWLALPTRLTRRRSFPVLLFVPRSSVLPSSIFGFIFSVAGTHIHDRSWVIRSPNGRVSRAPPRGVRFSWLSLVTSPVGRAPRRFIPRLRDPLGDCFSFSCRSVLQTRLFIVLLFWCRELAARLPVTACSSFPPVPACATATVLML
jgi:hypothetical protein